MSLGANNEQTVELGSTPLDGVALNVGLHGGMVV